MYNYAPQQIKFGHVSKRATGAALSASSRFTVLLHTYLTVYSNAAVYKADVNKDGGR